MNSDQVIVRADVARTFCQEVFEKAGLSTEDAFLVADALIDADLRGVSTHGLVRFPIYVTRLRRGLVKAKPQMRVVRTKGATLVLDGDHGFGQVIGAEGMQHAVGLAREHGVGLCAIRNGTHLGALAYIAATAVPHQMIGITLTITNPVIAPWGGVVPKLGNNPLAVAVPAGNRPPVIFDMTRPQRLGHLVMAVNIADCCPLTEFLRAMEGMIGDLKSTPRAEGVEEIWMPGEMEMRRREERLRDGFPVSRVVLEEVRAMGVEFGVRWPA